MRVPVLRAQMQAELAVVAGGKEVLPEPGEQEKTAEAEREENGHENSSAGKRRL